MRATEVQYWVAQWPGVPAWPITQPVSVPTNVTELGRKFAGTGAGSDAAAAAARPRTTRCAPAPVGVAVDDVPGLPRRS